KVADGQSCSDTEVCGPVSACLNPSTFVEACSAVCVRFGVENEVCGLHCGDGPPCFDGPLCGPGLTCLDGTCVKAAGLGQGCNGPQQIRCGFGLFCDADPDVPDSVGACARPASGGPCRIDAACPANERCQAGTCAARRGLGSPCADAPAACAEWTACDTVG